MSLPALHGIFTWLQDWPCRKQINFRAQLPLAAAAAVMGLPEEASYWDNATMLSYIWMTHADRILVFAMGSHERLGMHSYVRYLTDELLAVIADMFWNG
jgi:hypothetical protein